MGIRKVLALCAYLDIEARIASDVPLRSFMDLMMPSSCAEVVVDMLLVRRKFMVGFQLVVNVYHITLWVLGQWLCYKSFVTKGRYVTEKRNKRIGKNFNEIKDLGKIDR